MMKLRNCDDLIPMTNEVFALPIRNLPLADIPLEGVTAYLSQGDNHQVIFMHFKNDVILPEHSHRAQIGFVLEGEIELTIDGVMYHFSKGDRYFIPEGVRHSGRIFAGYADITFFDEMDRYIRKKDVENGD